MPMPRFSTGEQGQELAGLDREVERADGVDPAVVALADIDEPDERFRTSRAHASTMGKTFRRCRANSVPDLSAVAVTYPPHWCLLIPIFIVKVSLNKYLTNA
jgi:hypothetical protein